MKAEKYRDEAAASGYRYSFGAFAIEIFGCWGSSATSLLSRWTQHAEVDGTVDTRHIMGWSAPHWQELARLADPVACLVFPAFLHCFQVASAGLHLKLWLAVDPGEVSCPCSGVDREG